MRAIRVVPSCPRRHRWAVTLTTIALLLCLSAAVLPCSSSFLTPSRRKTAAVRGDLRRVGHYQARGIRGAASWLAPRAAATAAEDGGLDYDVAILGSGPASLSLAALLTASSSSLRVGVFSKRAEKRWVPNYGCWTEEWKALDALYASKGVPGLLEHGTDVRWADTDCFFGEDDDGSVASNPEGRLRRTLGREYLRVSREGLKSIFYPKDGSRKYDVIQDDVLGSAVNTNVFAPSGAVTFHPTHTELTLETSRRKVRAKIVVDGTGAESRFTIRDGREKEGYQIAYGAEARVEGEGVTDSMIGEYDRQKMTLFDYRSEAWRTAENLDEQKVITEPTFNYVMPLSRDVIFFEETSLVANPAMSFEECKRRLNARLASQGVRITETLEEEFCYIPMGGDVPRKGQRIVPVGAAAGIVHPSTGYQVARCLSSNVDVCEQILIELGERAVEGFDPDVAAARIIGRTWTPAAIRQRNFAVFGGDFLMAQDVEGLKGFFSGFFKLDMPTWAGFLAGWKNLPNNELHEDWLPRIAFGVKFLTKLPFKVCLDMVSSIVRYTYREGLDLIQSVTPFVGEPETFQEAFKFRASNGDVAAKKEALDMMCNCDPCEKSSEQRSKVHPSEQLETVG